MSNDRSSVTNRASQSVVTDENGRASFTVPPGTYELSVTPPAGYRSVPAKVVVIEDGATKAVTFELSPERSWLQTISFFIPESIREPWYGDLCEDRERMFSEGRSPAFIQLATAVQMVILVAHWLRELILALLRRLIIGL